MHVERDFGDTCVIAPTKTWLDEAVSDTDVLTSLSSARTEQGNQIKKGAVESVFMLTDVVKTIKIHS